MVSTNTPPEDIVPEWQKDLDQIGILRRILRAKNWYGGDWWFVVIGASILFVNIIFAIFPGYFSAHNPREEVGPRLLAPGQVPDIEVVIGRKGEGVEDVADFTGNNVLIGVVLGEPSSQVMREKAAEIAKQLKASGSDVILRPKPQRYETIEGTLDAVVNGEILAAVISRNQWEIQQENYQTLVMGNNIRDVAPVSFPLGTNAIGQDVLSRAIWGTRTALMIGLSAALVAILIGVPLGLFSGFIGGGLDRVLTLVMDSIYAFPGLILAIAIAAVLGPSILNIILVLAFVYVPTYYRIVRGQTLSIKEQLYIEAAKSLGAKRWSILGRYIFPNVIPSVGIIFSVNVADAILTGASLSFFGLGLPPDIVEWGIDVARGQPFLRQAWWLITVPGTMIMLVTLAFTMVGESLAEIFNPKLAEQ